MFSTAARNIMLDNLGLTHVSLHTDYSNSGANEIAGGSYARKSISFSAASSGVKAASNQPVFDVPANTTVAWSGGWSAITSGTFLGMAPLGGSPKEFLVDTTAFTVICPSHGYAAGDTVVFYGGQAPGALTEGQTYYVVNPAATTFQVSATQGGSPISINAQGAPSCILSRIAPETYGSSGGSLTLTTDNLQLNF